MEYANGKLLVKAPKLRSWLPRTNGGSVNVTVELPTGSNVHGDAAMADFTCDGPLGECRLKTGLGRVRVDEAGTLSIKTGIGDITVFTGYRHDMPELYALMNVCVLPSHREGMPRSPMEAAAMGIPCVATAIRGCGRYERSSVSTRS